MSHDFTHKPYLTTILKTIINPRNRKHSLVFFDLSGLTNTHKDCYATFMSAATIFLFPL
jgi:hypothetical protein